MARSPYCCTCYTCQQEAVAESYEAANDFFDRHASRGHDVEITRMEPDQAPTPVE